MELFKDRLKELREDAGVSMQELADAIGVSNASICKWENGVSEPKVSYLIKLATYFDCTVDYLVGNTSDYNATQVADLKPTPKINQKERQLLQTYRKLTPKLQELLQNTVAAWQKSNKI